MNAIKIIFIGILILFIVIQFVPVNINNPKVTQEINTPDDVKAVLKRACYDCHSNETKVPFYAKIAPISFFIVNHIKEGRAELNFSEWDRYSSKQSQHKIKEIWEEINAGKMPLDYYRFVHSEAELTEVDKKLIQNWVENN